MFSKKYNQAFTLAELLLCIMIIAIIAAIVMPSLVQFRPQRNKAMFKKAYTLTERVVYNLVNDEELYSEMAEKLGLDNTERVDYNGTVYGGGTKFCELFALNFNTVGDNSSVNCGATGFENPSFTTTDGIKWVVANTDFGNNDDFNNSSSPVIQIDVNGDRNPNCFDRGTEENCTDPDRFDIYVRADGKIKVTGDYARRYLRELTLTNGNN